VSLTVAVRTLSRRLGIEMPVVDAAHAIVDAGTAPEEDNARRLARPPGPEIKQG
jgi:hypothetical protein